jgi:stress-induced morphogen
MQAHVDNKRTFAFRIPGDQHNVPKTKKHPSKKKKKHRPKKTRKAAAGTVQEASNTPSVQTQLESIISATINPLHLEVHNMSCWYANRRALGVKYFWYRGVEQNKNSRWWETHLYYTGEDDLGHLSRKKVFVESHKKEAQAVRAIEIAAAERNAEDPEAFRKSDEDLEKPLSDNFRIVVVSEKFKRKSVYERLEMVYSPLMSYFDCERQPFTSSATDLRWKRFGYVGYHVLNLPQYNYMNHGASFAVACLTPVEWEPKVYASSLTERFGPSHLSARKAGNDPKTRVMPSLLRTIMAEGTDDKERIEQVRAFRYLLFGIFYFICWGGRGSIIHLV